MYDLPDLPDLPPLPDLPIINNEIKPVKYNMRLYAILSKLSYDKNPIHLFGHYHLLNQFKILSNFSNTDMLTVKDNYTGQVIVAFRGSDDKNKTGNFLRDFIQNNYNIAVGNKNKLKRVEEVEEHLKQLINKYGADNVTLTGHSLGGSVASIISRDMGLKAYVFNIGSSIMDDETAVNTNLTHYTTNNIKKGIIDVLSVSSTLRDDYTTYIVNKKQGVNTHSIDNFLP